MTNPYPSYGSSASGGTGATSLVVTSPDDSIIQEGASSYNPTLSQLTIALRAVGGGGGMTNPMTEAGDLIIGGTPVGGVAPPVRLPKGTATQVLTIDATTSLPVWGDNFGLKQYTQEKYVDNANGNDTTGDGSYAKPWKTIAHSLTVIPENSTLFVMSSNVDETTVILTANANINIVAFGNRQVNIPQFVVNSTIAGTISFAGITIGGLAIQPTTICDVYLDRCIITNSINKRGAGYLECNFVDASTNSISIRSGTFSAFGGKFSDLTVNLTGSTPPIATFNNCKINGAINVQDGANLTLINNLITNTTEDPVLYSDTGFGTVVNMIGNELRTASGAPAAVSVDTYTLYNQIFDKENSTFGTSSSDTSWFDKLGITTTETITTATTMLVRNADGSIAEQLIPSGGGAYQYSKIRYVDPVGGNDITGNGAYGNPWKTVAHAVNAVSSGMIICLMGTTSEIAFSISKTNLDIIALGTRSALNGFTNLVTITGTGAGSIRFQDLNFAGGLTRQAASTCGLYVYNGSIGSGFGFNQAGNGYTEFVGVDASNSAHGISSGTFNVFGGKITFPTITGSTASVTFDNVDYIAGNGTSTTAAMINILESNWIASTTGFALTVTDINAITTIQGCNIIRPDGTLAPVSLTFFDIQDTDFNRDESSLGMHVGNTDWFSKLGLVVEPNAVTTADYYLTLAAGVISKQRQATQVNLPATSMYSAGATITTIDLKTLSGGSLGIPHPAQVANGSSGMIFNELFSVAISQGSQFRAKGNFMLYNVALITSATYSVRLDLLGINSLGQLILLGSPLNYTLDKTAYTYNKIDFDASVPSSPYDFSQIGIRITVTGAQTNETALINSLFAEYILS